MIKRCEICGKEFATRNATKTCSKECKRKLYAQTLEKCLNERKERGRKGGPVGRPKTHKEHRYTPNENETKCWSCQKYYKGCNWSKHFKPVRGWKADKIKIKNNNGKDKPVFTDSFFVRECPEYIQDEPRRR